MFELLKTDSHTQARLGKLTTAHGVVDTPVYMPVGTQAASRRWIRAPVVATLTTPLATDNN